MAKALYFIFSFQLIFLQMNAQHSTQSDMDELKRLNATFIHNYVISDTASHSKIIHPGFVYLNSQGKYVNRRDYLINWVHGYEGIKYWDYRDERITIFGNTALVRAQNKYIIENDGKQITGMACYTDIYIKEKGKWLCIQAQVGNVTPENYADDKTIVKKYE